MLLLDCRRDRARETAENILSAVKNYRFFWEGDVFEVGISIGVTPINSSSGDIHKVFQSTDTACYIAKSLGKNRIHIYGEDSSNAIKSE